MLYDDGINVVYPIQKPRQSGATLTAQEQRTMQLCMPCMRSGYRVIEWSRCVRLACFSLAVKVTASPCRDQSERKKVKVARNSCSRRCTSECTKANCPAIVLSPLTNGVTACSKTNELSCPACVAAQSKLNRISNAAKGSSNCER